MHDLGHGRVVNAGWAAVNEVDIAGCTHSTGNTRGNFRDSSYQFLTVLFTECAHSALQFSRLWNDIEGCACDHASDCNHRWAKRRSLTTDQRLQGRNNVGRHDDGSNPCFRHSRVAALALNGYHEFIGTGKDRTGTNPHPSNTTSPNH